MNPQAFLPPPPVGPPPALGSEHNGRPPRPPSLPPPARPDASDSSAVAGHAGVPSHRGIVETPSRGPSRKIIAFVLVVALLVGGVVAFMTKPRQNQPAAMATAPVTRSAAVRSPALPPSQKLGAPIASEIPPAVIPADATLNAAASGPLGAALQNFVYNAPMGVSSTQLTAWYSTHMPPGKDFHRLRWAYTDNATGSPTWSWCTSTPGQRLDVTVSQNGPVGGNGPLGTANQTSVFITLQQDDAGDC